MPRQVTFQACARFYFGYLYGENGEWFAFSLMAMEPPTHDDIEELQDKVLELLADFAAKPTPASDFAAPASP
ncbi:MAG: hypothetical protein RMI34_07905 [Chloroherpetonaceae bacterium]|nr:hypothetical protein [Chloroherpetonaceae bacterium]